MEDVSEEKYPPAATGAGTPEHFKRRLYFYDRYCSHLQCCQSLSCVKTGIVTIYFLFPVCYTCHVKTYRTPFRLSGNSGISPYFTAIETHWFILYLKKGWIIYVCKKQTWQLDAVG